ncbi:Arc family DNA-binding protein [Rhizobium sp. FY34]|uniref:Arc family DNA-binding protein n=1 Tax=Rhizobium sp. FY34 TaxID=2562309 RepID=UPI00148559F5|nr:Arc family DNA-binding protein [Rhizobium sp. FY34]
MKPNQDVEKFVVRLPSGMRQTIKSEAEKQCRSMNAEVIYQLSRAYRGDETQKADAQA